MTTIDSRFLFSLLSEGCSVSRAELDSSFRFASPQHNSAYDNKNYTQSKKKEKKKKIVDNRLQLYSKLLRAE